MELVLWVIVALLVSTSAMLVAKSRHLEMIAIDPGEQIPGRARKVSHEGTRISRASQLAWYRRQDTNRRSIWLKQW
jgi:hypothetical protein